jgi:hypothetical protein
MFDDPGKQKQRRKAQLIMAAVCGPVFSATLILASFLFMQLDLHLPFFHSDNGSYWLQPAFVTSLAATFAVGDPLSKRLNISAMHYSGPVAFSCTACIVIFLIALSATGLF